MKNKIFANILTITLVVLAIILVAIPQSVLAKASKGTNDKDLQNMNKARKLFEKNKITEAIETYNQVSKNSDFWTDSMEEKAWAHTKSQDYDKALAELKSIFNPVFLPFAGPETIMLASFIDYKICNYKGVFEKIKIYKETMLPRVEALEALVRNTKSELVKNTLAKLAKENITGSNLGTDISKLPRFFYADKKLVDAVRSGKTQKAQNRLAVLANRDLDEISKNLKKMKVIEIEVIQRSFLIEPQQLQGDLKFDKKKSADIMIFPDEADSSEVWLDEIGNYEVKTMKCPTNPKSTNSGSTSPGGKS